MAVNPKTTIRTTQPVSPTQAARNAVKPGFAPAKPAAPAKTVPPAPVPAKKPVPPAPTPLTGPANSSAMAQVQQTLDNLGLGSLTQWAWDKVKNGENLDQIVLEMRQRPEYQARFPAMDQLSKLGRGMSEAQYVALEGSYRQVLRGAGFPVGFYDQPDDIAKFLINDVSPSEVQQRAQDATAALYTAPAAQRQQFQQMYQLGASPGDIAAYMLDPTKAEPILHRQWAAAQISGQAVQAGFGGLTTSQAEELASQGLTPDQFTQGFDTLQKAQQVMGQLPGADLNPAGSQITRDQQLEAAFMGDASQQLRIAQAEAQRLAEDKGQMKYAQTAAGFAGLGAANQQ